MHRESHPPLAAPRHLPPLTFRLLIVSPVPIALPSSPSSTLTTPCPRYHSLTCPPRRVANTFYFVGRALLALAPAAVTVGNRLVLVTSSLLDRADTQFHALEATNDYSDKVLFGTLRRVDVVSASPVVPMPSPPPPHAPLPMLYRDGRGVCVLGVGLCPASLLACVGKDRDPWGDNPNTHLSVPRGLARAHTQRPPPTPRIPSHPTPRCWRCARTTSPSHPAPRTPTP